MTNNEVEPEGGRSLNRKLGTIWPSSPDARKFVTSDYLHERKSYHHPAGPAYVIEYFNNLEVRINEDHTIDIVAPEQASSNPDVTRYQRVFTGHHTLEPLGPDSKKHDIERYHAVARAAIAHMMRVLKKHYLDEEIEFFGHRMKISDAASYIMNQCPYDYKHGPMLIGIYFWGRELAIGPVAVVKSSDSQSTFLTMATLLYAARTRGKILTNQALIETQTAYTEWVKGTWLRIEPMNEARSAREKLVQSDVDINLSREIRKYNI